MCNSRLLPSRVLLVVFLSKDDHRHMCCAYGTGVHIRISRDLCVSRMQGDDGEDWRRSSALSIRWQMISFYFHFNTASVTVVVSLFYYRGIQVNNFVHYFASWPAIVNHPAIRGQGRNWGKILKGNLERIEKSNYFFNLTNFTNIKNSKCRIC